MRGHAALLVLLSLVLSCTSLTKEDCEKTNWPAFGAKDAREGEILTAFRKREQQCKKFGVAPDKAAYMQGYNTGLKAYCTPENGRLLGEQGEELKDVCPPDLIQGFTEGWREGHARYEAIQREKELKAREEAVIKKEAELDARENALKAPEPGGICSTDSDCVQKSMCSFGRCYNGRGQCSMNSDCDRKGFCQTGKCRYY